MDIGMISLGNGRLWCHDFLFLMCAFDDAVEA